MMFSIGPGCSWRGPFKVADPVCARTTYRKAKGKGNIVSTQMDRAVHVRLSDRARYTSILRIFEKIGRLPHII